MQQELSSSNLSLVAEDWQKFYINILVTTLIMGQLILKACYTKLLSKNVSSNVAQKTIIYGKNATKVICKDLTPYVP